MTTPAVTLAPVPLAEKAALWAMMADYLIEHAALADPEGRYDPLEYEYFDAYWVEPDRRPCWIEADGARAGFVLMNTWSPSGLGTQHSIAEFCVLKAQRRHGVGRAAATAALRSRRGQWELQVYRANLGGMAFWPRAIATAGAVSHEVIEREDRLIHRFQI